MQVCAGHTGTQQRVSTGVSATPISMAPAKIPSSLPSSPSKLEQHHETKGKAGKKTAQTQVLSPLWASGEASKMGISCKMRQCPKVPGRAKGFAKSSLDLEQGDWMEKIDEQWCKCIVSPTTGNLEPSFPTHGPHQPVLG